MVWVELPEPFDYRFLDSGELQYRDRTGQYRVAAGVTPHGYHLFDCRLERLNELVDEAPDGLGIHQLFTTSEPIRFEAAELLRLSGIDPDWVSLKQWVWLLCDRRDDDGNLHPAPLPILNELPEARHPASGKGEPLTDRVKFLSAISAQSDSIADAYTVATSQPASEVLSVLEERAWQSMDGKDKHEAGLKEWAENRRKQLAQRAGKRPPAGGNP